MAYTHTTLAQLKTQLAARLHDSSKVFFVDAELGVYLTESLRTFNALSGMHRARQTLPTVASTAFYSLPTAMSAELGYTVTDRDLINAIQYHLLEPATSSWAGGWTGTEMFTMLDVQNALQNRRNQFLAETGVVLTYGTQAVGSPPVGRITLADTVMDVRRAMWINSSSVKTQLWRSTEIGASAYDRSWEVDSGIPYAYSVQSPPPLSLQLIPYSVDVGTLELFTVSAGATLDYTSGVILGIPDDWTWVVKWGALADLLSKDGPGKDDFRADICETKYRLGMTLAREVPCVLHAQLNGVSLFTSSLQELDAAEANWQNETAATAEFIAIAGHNYVGVSPVPDGVYSLTFDVVRKFPVPAGDGSYVEVGREQLDMILDYAEHLAAFKMGGHELNVTNRLWENFLRQSISFNERLSASTIKVATDRSYQEEKHRPRRMRGVGVGTIISRQDEVANG